MKYTIKIEGKQRRGKYSSWRLDSMQKKWSKTAVNLNLMMFWNDNLPGVKNFLEPFERYLETRAHYPLSASVILIVDVLKKFCSYVMSVNVFTI